MNEARQMGLESAVVPSYPDLPSEDPAYPWSTTAQTYSKENSRSKNLLIFKLHTTLSRVTKS